MKHKKQNKKNEMVDVTMVVAGKPKSFQGSHKEFFEHIREGLEKIKNKRG